MGVDMNVATHVGESVAASARAVSSAPLWPGAIVALFAAINALWLILTDASLDQRSMFQLASLLSGSMVIGWIAYNLRRYDIFYTLFGGIAFMMFATPMFRIFNHLSMSLAFPWADGWLSSADMLLGFDWMQFLRWVDGEEVLLVFMDWSYLSLDQYTAVFYLFLIAIPERRRACFELLALFTLTAAICMVIGLFFPAQAAMVYYAPDLTGFANIHERIGTYHMEPLERLRSDVPPLLELIKLPGLVTFPSFHTAMGIVLVYACRWRWWLFVPSLAINLIMILSTLLYGSHYLIDIIASTVVTLATIMILRKWLRVPASEPEAASNQAIL